MQNIKQVHVENMVGNSGREIANQFIISAYDNEGNLHEYFQSYSSIIVKRDTRGNVELDDRYWNYSRTTSKYRSIFLGENTKETEKKIKEGIYKLTNLN